MKKLKQKNIIFLKKRVDKSDDMVYNRYCCEGQNKNETHNKENLGV